MARNRLSWKWKLVLGFILSFLILMVLALTPYGHKMAKEHIRKAFEEMPADERRASAYADWWLRLAWWAGAIRSDPREAADMYIEFLGIKPDAKGRDFTITLKLNGLVSEDGKTGWGPFHPRAVEAFHEYLDFIESEKTTQFYNGEMFRMYRLFYQWSSMYGEKKIHPCFKKHWSKLMERATIRRIKWPEDIDRAAPRAPASPPDC